MKVLIIILFSLCAVYLQAQVTLYNGREIPLHIDSNQTDFTRKDNAGVDRIQWFIMGRDTFAKVYTYLAEDHKQLQMASLIHFASTVDGDPHNKANWEYFGTQTTYRKKGGIEQTYTYENGKYNGEYKWYHTNGVIGIVGKYTDGKATGEWRFFNHKGELQKIKEF